MTDHLIHDIWIITALGCLIWQIIEIRKQWVKDTATIHQLINEINELKRRVGP